MYSGRYNYNYNTNKAGPSRHSFTLAPSQSEGAFSHMQYHDDYNYSPSQMSYSQHSETLPLRDNYNCPIQNHRGSNTFQSSHRKRGNVNFNMFSVHDSNVGERDSFDYRDRGDHERQHFNNYRKFNMHSRLESPTQKVKKSCKKNQNSAQTQSIRNDYKLCICPGCSTKFDCFARYNYFTGKVPFILNCKHTLCEECIHKLVTNDSLLCPVCQKPSVLPPNTTVDNLQSAFTPNHYLIGMILWSKTYSNSSKFDHTLVTVEPVKKTSSFTIFNKEEQQPEEKCCFNSCKKVATLHCQECNDVYCINCCTIVHKSAKSLWSHSQTAITKATISLELERCMEHNMDIEFMCRVCEITACCYCFLEKHEGHEKENLTKLSEPEMEELLSIKDKTQKILKQLIISQKRVEGLYTYNMSKIEEKICNFFINYHAKLQFIEKNLRKEIPNMYPDEHKHEDLDEISSELRKSIEKLTSIVTTCENLDLKNLNLKEVLKTLRSVENTPCYLFNQNDTKAEPIEFVVDSAAENIEDYFKVMKNPDCLFKLVCEDELPPDYKKDPLEQQYESDADSIIQSVKSTESEIRKKKQPNIKHMPERPKTSDIEEVEVTHIESLECFYVQLRKMQGRFLQMNREMDNYVKMGAGTVDQPHINKLYLVLYVRNKERLWCRGRVTEFKNGETEPLYEVHFIDHGSTQTLDITRFREITPSLANRKPFAISCELQNPTYANWDKNAHVYMGKMINGKKVYMSTKEINNGTHVVDLMVSSSDGGLTSIVDILINTCSNPLDTGSGNESRTNYKKTAYSQSAMVFSNSMKFEKAQVEEVMIANIVDPHRIFVHIAKHAESLKKMTENLRTHYKFSQKNSCIPVEGSYVVVEYKDRVRGNWHRALIKKVDVNTEKVHVLLVDWGQNVSVSWGNIRILKEAFTKLESQAIMIKLAHVEPFEKGSAWSASASMALEKYFRAKDVLKMIVHNTDPLEVALFEILPEVDICINAKLVKDRSADSTGTLSKTLEWPRDLSTSGGCTGDEDLVDALLRKMDDEDENCTSDDDDDNQYAIMRSRISVVKFVDPSVIYIKFAFNDSKELELHKDLQVHYSKDRKMRESWEAGEDCVVLYNLSYARGRIVSSEGNDMYTINIYDKPLEVVLPLKKIFEYSKYFNRYISVVFKAHLADIRPSGGDKWSLSSIETLERVFEKYKDVYGTKTAAQTEDKSIPMHMWYTQIKMGGALEAAETRFISINKRLVKMGFAYKEKSIDPSTALTSVLERLATKSETSGTADEDSESVTSCSSKKSKHSSMAWTDMIEVEEKIAAVSEKEEEEATDNIEGKDDDEEDEEKKSSPYHTSIEEIEDWIPAFRLTKSEFDAVVTCAEIEGIIYLRDKELQTVYDEMENNIKIFFDKLPKQATAHHDWQPGQLCTISYEGYWYRGKVDHVNSPNDISVIMIDFGSDHNLKAEQLYREIMFPKIPAFASKVKLHGVFAKSGAWLSSDYECLMDIITENARIIMKGSLNVDLPTAEIYTDAGVNVNAALVERCPNLTRIERIIDDTDESDDDVVVIEEESIVVMEEHPEEVAYEPVDTSMTPFVQEPLPEEAFVDKALFSVVGVLAYDKVVVKKSTKEMPVAFYELTEKIQDQVSEQPTLEKFEVGMSCICLYADDGVWYRARIHNTDGIDCNYVFVFFVDFGNIDSVPTAEVKMMRPEWFEYPVACHVVDVNIGLKGDNHVEHVMQHTRKLFGKDKLVKVVQKKPVVVDIYNADGECFYQPLVNRGIVVVKVK